MYTLCAGCAARVAFLSRRALFFAGFLIGNFELFRPSFFGNRPNFFSAVPPLKFRKNSSKGLIKAK